MIKHNRIIIVGHMGAGKSLLGKALAEKLGWEHIDTNLGLERYVGRELNHIIGKQGAEAFYLCQNEILKHYLGDENVVITTEDSYIQSEKNRKLLSHEYVVYLKVTTAVQIERMSTCPAPLLPVNIEDFLNKLHLERDSLYEEVAKFTLESKSLEYDLNKIIKDIEG